MYLDFKMNVSYNMYYQYLYNSLNTLFLVRV